MKLKIFSYSRVKQTREGILHVRHHIPAKKKPPKNTFQIKLGISIAIIASALVLKTFAGGPAVSYTHLDVYKRQE